MYVRSFRGTHDDNDTESDVEVQMYSTMDKKSSWMDAVDSFFYEYRLVPNLSDGVTSSGSTVSHWEIITKFSRSCL